MPLKIICLFLLMPLQLYSVRPINTSRYSHAGNAPETINIKNLVRYLKKGAKTDTEKVETFFYWISQNIEYDMDLANKDDRTLVDISIDSTLIKKQTICSGYSRLFFFMCHYSNIECKIIEGETCSYDDSASSLHAWNAVKIDNKWQLIDVTWGSGYFSIHDGSYIKSTDMKYFFADPSFLIIDHYPDHWKWQLLDKPLNKKKFNGEEWNLKRYTQRYH